MPKNIFFMSFLYVFIACAMFVAATVHSTPTEERGMTIASHTQESFRGVHHPTLTDSLWPRR